MEAVESEAHRLLSLRSWATDMSDHVTIAFWVRDGRPDYHFRQVHESFAKMADLLGYEIKLKDAEKDAA